MFGINALVAWCMMALWCIVFVIIVLSTNDSELAYLSIVLMIIIAMPMCVFVGILFAKTNELINVSDASRAAFVIINMLDEGDPFVAVWHNVKTNKLLIRSGITHRERPYKKLNNNWSILLVVDKNMEELEYDILVEKINDALKKSKAA